MGFFDFLFGPGKDAKRTNEMIQQNQDRINQRSGELQSQLDPRADSVMRRDDAAYNYAMGGEDGSGGYLGLLRNAYGSSGGGDPSAGLTWGDEQTPELNADRDWFRNYAQNPIDAEGINRIRGKGVFDEYAQTGGWDAGRKADYRARASSVVPSFYGNLKNELARQANVTGQTGGGLLTSSMGRAARQQAQAGQDAVREGEISLADAVDKGRQWGTSSLSNAEQGLQGLLGQLKLASMGQSANIGQGLMNSADQRASAQGNLNLGAQGLDIQRQGLDLNRQIQALTGIQNLRNSNPGEAADIRGNQTNLFNAENSANQGNLALRAQNNPNRSLFQNLMQLGGLASPLLGAFGGGGGGEGMAHTSSSPNPFASSGSSSYIPGQGPGYAVNPVSYRG